MKTRILTAASALAIMAAMPAIMISNAHATAGTGATTQQQWGVQQDTQQHGTQWEGQQRTQQSWTEDTGQMNGQQETIRAAVIDDDQVAMAEPRYINIDQRMTATGMIGRSVYSQDGERLADVEDIIIDADGQALMVVVSEGGFLGIGERLAAFDYNLITHRDADGDIIMQLDRQAIDQAAGFRYERNNNGAGVRQPNQTTQIRQMPENAFSVSELLDSELVDHTGETVAQVDNILFRDGQADQVIVRFDQVLGLGGERAAIEFENVQLGHRDKDNGERADREDARFKLDETQARNFDHYRQTMTNR